jgi:hypothetical protein
MKFQARSPNRAQLVEHLCELLQTLLPVFMPLHLFNLELLDLVFDCRKLGVDPAGETVDVVVSGREVADPLAITSLLPAVPV